MRLAQKGGNEMSIKTIPRSEFDRLVLHNPVLEGWMVEQVEWFSDTSGNSLGAIAKGKGVAGWNYVILERDRKRHLSGSQGDEQLFWFGSRQSGFVAMDGREREDCQN